MQVWRSKSSVVVSLILAAVALVLAWLARRYLRGAPSSSKKTTKTIDRPTSRSAHDNAVVPPPPTAAQQETAVDESRSSSSSQAAGAKAMNATEDANSNGSREQHSTNQETISNTAVPSVEEKVASRVSSRVSSSERRVSIVTIDEPSQSGEQVSQSRKSSSRTSRRHREKDPSSSSAQAPTLPSFIMLMGIPGSGKSTWAEQYVSRIDASFTVVSSDAIRTQLTGSIDDQKRNDEVWSIVLNQVVGGLKNGRNIILDATNTRTDLRRTFVRQLPPCIRYLKVFQVSKAIAKIRVAKDLNDGVVRSAVSDVVMDRMHASFVESMAAIDDEGWKMK